MALAVAVTVGVAVDVAVGAMVKIAGGSVGGCCSVKIGLKPVVGVLVGMNWVGKEVGNSFVTVAESVKASDGLSVQVGFGANVLVGVGAMGEIK